MNFEVEVKRTGEIPAVPFDQAVVSKRGASSNDKGAGNLENTAPGDIFLYKDVDFGEYGCTNFAMSCGAKDTGVGKVSFILDSKDNEPFLTVDNQNTGGWTKWATVTASVNPDVVKGKHDLYVKFSGTNSYVGNYQYFNFTNPTAPAVLPAEETQGPLYMVSTSSGVNEAASDAMINRAVEVAKKADYVIFLGGTDWSKPDSHETGTEGHDRWVLTLPGNQADVINALYAANKNTIVVLESGSSLDLTAIKDVPAILEAWYGGQAQGQAICDAIFGDINPSGHLTSTWYADLNELPSATDSPLKRKGMMEYNIDDWGYTYMYYGKATKKQQKGTPQFPFGHGLSYTTFDYTNATATAIPSASGDGNVSVTIKNTGSRKGADVIQVYANFNGDSNYGTLNKRLVGFKRVELEPSEEKTVDIPVSYRSLSYYSEASHQYLVDGNSITLQVSTSSADADIKKTVAIQPNAGIAGETYVSTHIDEIPEVASARQLLKSDHIYTVMGAYVCQASDYDKLPNGIYVLNGVKYIKK